MQGVRVGGELQSITIVWGLGGASSMQEHSGLYGALQVISVPPLGPGETAGAEVPVAQNPAMANPAANPAIIQVHGLAPTAA